MADSMKIQDITQVELSTKEPSDASHIYVEEDGVFRRHSLDAMKLAVQPDVEKEARAYATAAAASEKAAAESETAAKASETNAATSETNAAKSESNASGYAKDAANAKDAAVSSASAAATSQTAAAASADTASTAATTATTAAASAEAYKDEAFSVTPAGYEDVAKYATQGVIIDDDGYFYALVEGA